MNPPDTHIPMLDLTHEVDEHWNELHEAIARVLRSGRFILGPEVEAFEREVAAYLGVQHAIGLNSGTDALIIGLRALGIGPGDEVITTGYSFFATAEAIALVGAAPVFVDIRLDTFNLDPDLLEAAVTERTRAILPVHLFGKAADMDRIMAVAWRHGLKVLEDCAQSFGAWAGGTGGRRVEDAAAVGPAAGGDAARSTSPESVQKTGAIGHAGAFSFYPTKNLGAYGDGGLLATSDDEVARVARMLRAHGSPAGDRYRHEAVGYNSRLDEIQAAVLRVKLPRVDAANRERRQLAEWYRQRLQGHAALATPPISPGHVFHQYAVLLPADLRDDVQAALAGCGIGTAAFYPHPLDGSYAAATGREARTWPSGLPTCHEASRRILNLPIWPGMQQADVEQITATLLRALDQGQSCRV